MAPYVIRLFSDVYATAPRLFVLFLFLRIWQGLEEAFLTHLSTRILRAVSSFVCSKWIEFLLIAKSIGRLNSASFEGNHSSLKLYGHLVCVYSAQRWPATWGGGGMFLFSFQTRWLSLMWSSAFSDQLLARLRSQITAHFDLYLMRVRLRMDIPAALSTCTCVGVSQKLTFGRNCFRARESGRLVWI